MESAAETVMAACVFGNTNQTPMRHDFKRAYYRVLLSEFEPEDIKKLLSQAPLVMDGKRFSLKEVCEHLWKPKGWVPFAWDCATDTDLEPFLLSKGRSMEWFMRKALWQNNNSSVIPGKVLLSWFYPRLGAMFGAPDARELLFPLITLHNRNWMPNVNSRRIRKREEGDWVKSLLVFIHDSTYSERLDWDFDSIAGPQFRAVPGMLSMPHFDRNVMVGDTRHVEHVIWHGPDRPRYEDETLFIRGEPFGKRMGFSAFCREEEIDLEAFRPPDLPVVRMDKDYSCPIRKRVVLYRGCAYGAPFYLHSIEYRKSTRVKKDLLTNIVADLAKEDEVSQDELESKHLALLASIRETFAFRYFHADESMSLNDATFIKGVSAKILKYLLEALLHEGRSSFEHKELKRRFDITQGQKNSNFEIRFYRLVEKLGNEPSGLRIERTGRGRFRVVVQGAVRFESIEAGSTF